MFYLHMCKRIESGSVEIELFLQSLRWEELTSRQRCREAHVEHPPCFRIRLHVKHKHIIRRYWQHRWHSFQKVSEQRGQEVLLGHVLQSHGNAAAEHLLRDDENPQHALSADAVNAIWETQKGRNEEAEIRLRNYFITFFKPVGFSYSSAISHDLLLAASNVIVTLRMTYSSINQINTTYILLQLSLSNLRLLCCSCSQRSI